MGVAVAARIWPLRTEKLASVFRYLSAFGLTHGLSEWVELLGPDPGPFATWAEAALKATSLLLLFLFGAGLALFKSSRRAQRSIALVVTALMLGSLVTSRVAPGTTELAARWLAGLPGAWLAAGALTRGTLREYTVDRGAGGRAAVALAVALGVYGLAVVVGPPGSFFPASVINQNAFFELTTIHIQVVRAVLGAVMSAAAVLSLDLFASVDQRELDRKVVAATAPIERARQNFQSLFETAPVAVGVVGSDGLLRMTNPSFAALVGAGDNSRLRSLEGARLRDFVHPDDWPAVESQLDHPQSTPVDGRVVRADGRVLHVEWTASSQTWETEAVKVVFGRDVTERRQLAATSSELDHMSAVGALAAGVGHEINNPLTYLLADLDMVATHLPPLHLDAAGQRVDLRELVAEARTGALRIRDVVRDLRAFASSPPGSTGDVEPNWAIEAAIRVVWPELEGRARITRALETTPRAALDGPRLGQVVVSLLRNAARLLPEPSAGSTPEVVVRSTTDTEGHAVVEVLLPGRQLDAAELERTFDAYLPGHRPGLGLGVARAVVRSSGGELTATNSTDGALFRVSLPPAPPRSRSSVALRNPATSSRRGRVLVVDNEALVAAALRRVLEPHHDVECVASGKEALELLSAEPYDAVLAEVGLPGVSGVDLYERLKAQSAASADRIIFLAGGTFTPGTRELLARIPNRQLEKPIDPFRLLSVVREVVG